MPQISQFFSTVTPYIIGVVLGIIGTFVSGFAKEFYDERARVSKHKIEVARHVLKICIEASTGNFRHPPRDIEHINSVLTDLEGIAKENVIEMEQFVSSWQYIAREHSKGDLSPDDVKFLKEQLDRAEENRKLLIAWANEIRVGK